MEQNRWLDLPKELLGLVKKRLQFIEYPGFNAVCKSWRSVVADKFLPPPPQIPLLMVRSSDHKDDNNNTEETCNFISVSNNMLHKIALPNNSKELICRSNYRCVGSYNGWSVLVTNNCEMHLLNPLSQAPPIQLPYLHWFRSISGRPPCNSIVRKCVISSSDPSYSLTAGDYTVMVVSNGVHSLAFFKAGNESWTFISQEISELYGDILYYKGQFYAVTIRGVLVVSDMQASFPRLRRITPPINDIDNFVIIHTNMYLVESSGGDLLLIVMFLETVSFKVYKFDATKNMWVQIFSLRDCVLFLGMNTSVSMTVQDFPELKPNSIYFTNDDNELRLGFFWFFGKPPAYDDMGVFNLEDGSFEKFFSTSSKQIFLPPIWFVPNPQTILDSREIC